MPSELSQLVFRYADRMFTLSHEMLDIVNYRKEANLLFDVGVADELSNVAPLQGERHGFAVPVFCMIVNTDRILTPPAKVKLTQPL